MIGVSSLLILVLNRSSAPSTYSGSGIVERSVAMGSPVVFVSMNYRRESHILALYSPHLRSENPLFKVSGIGFLASAEVVSK